MAEALIKAMGGKGGIVALGGIEFNVPAIERKAGLDEALAANPTSSCSTSRSPTGRRPRRSRRPAIWLTQFGDEISGIWAANDDMALAAVEALRADGRAGKVPVTGIDGIQLAVEAMRSGEMAGTVAWDPFWQGGMGLSIGYHAQDGEVRSRQGAAGAPRVLRHRRDRSRRRTRGVLRQQHQVRAELDWNDIWGRVSGQIQYLKASNEGAARLRPCTPPRRFRCRSVAHLSMRDASLR